VAINFESSRLVVMRAPTMDQTEIEFRRSSKRKGPMAYDPLHGIDDEARPNMHSTAKLQAKAARGRSLIE
jgi:hypothetical protein